MEKRRYKYWTEDDIRILAENYGVIPMQELSDLLGRGEATIRCKASQLGISSGYFFTKEEEEYIDQKYGIMSAKAIARKLNRPISSIYYKINQMGLGRICDNIDGFSFKETGEMLGVSDMTVGYWARTKGLKFKKVGKVHVVKEKDLVAWLKTHPKNWDATKVTVKWMWEGEKWFDQKRDEDFQRMITNRWGEFYPDAK